MSLSDELSTIAKLICTIKWTNFLSVLLGGLTTGYITYKFLKRREKDKLKVDLQIKAAEQILEEIRVVGDKSSMLFIPDLTSFQSYSSTAIFSEKNSPATTSAMQDFYNGGQLNQAKDRVRKCMDNFFELWKDYAFSYCKFINSFETKLVILNKFIGIKELLSEELKVMMEIENRIMHLYQFEISDCITYSKPIDDNLINQIKALENIFQEKKADIISIFHDLNVGLQNEFLGDLFGFKIPDRQPIDEIRYPVYKAGYKHIFKDI